MWSVIEHALALILLALVGGYVAFAVAFAIITTRFGRVEAQDPFPSRAVVIAMSIAFIFVALPFGGYLKDILPPPDEYAHVSVPLLASQ